MNSIPVTVDGPCDAICGFLPGVKWVQRVILATALDSSF